MIESEEDVAGDVDVAEDVGVGLGSALGGGAPGPPWTRGTSVLTGAALD